MKRHLLALLLITGSANGADVPHKFIRAIHMVESSGKTGRILGDYQNGIPRAIGPMQVHYSYWKDATTFDKSIGGRYEDCFRYDYSVKIVNAYMKRYCKNLNNFELMAKIQNGGPMGYRNPNTQHYWNKVKKYL